MSHIKTYSIFIYDNAPLTTILPLCITPKIGWVTIPKQRDRRHVDVRSQSISLSYGTTRRLVKVGYREWSMRLPAAEFLESLQDFYFNHSEGYVSKERLSDDCDLLPARHQDSDHECRDLTKLIEIGVDSGWYQPHSGEVMMIWAKKKSVITQIKMNLLDAGINIIKYDPTQNRGRHFNTESGGHYDF